ncbi:PHA synthase [Legionella cherrii]|uniref:PHA synthase n=1 Tax=Legionella cherrii TaxID=28084 RepID=A0ABY6TAY2_9GAMM|nr:PHA synthase [Legionella cherrii]
MKGTEKTNASTRHLKIQSTSPAESGAKPQYEIFKNQLDDFFYYINKLYQANLGKFTMGMSPAVIGTSHCAWLLQLAQSPGHLLALAFFHIIHSDEFLTHLLCDKQPAQGTDVRFHKENWQLMPWRFYAEVFLQSEEWWRFATRKVPGLSGRAERTVSFYIRQLHDALSPSNFVMTNPDLFYETIRSGGANLIQGTELAIEHSLRRLAGLPPPGAGKFKPGKNVAITPGKIVFTNHLIELIQYEPQQKRFLKSQY